MRKRIIGTYEGHETELLLILIGAIHGNEMAGVHAIEFVLKMLEVEPITNPNFEFRGNLIGLIGNRRAMHVQERYLDFDLNRVWMPESVDEIMATPSSELQTEKLEIKELLTTIRKSIKKYQPKQVILLDLHTTSSDGGIFTIPSDDAVSLSLAQELHAPVITRILDGISGTTLHYFNETNIGCPFHSLTFEAGQHDDPLSINRAIAAIINCMRSIGCVSKGDVENIHDNLLKDYSKGLPVVSELIYKHVCTPEDKFVMRPGYANFQIIEKGEVLADDINGEIPCLYTGRILMPLYQSLGNEGFFIIKSSDVNIFY